MIKSSPKKLLHPKLFIIEWATKETYLSFERVENMENRNTFVFPLFWLIEQSILFDYLIWKDEAQDTSSQLQDEDHDQTDTELGGGKKSRPHCNLNLLLCLHEAVAYERTHL